SFSPPLMFDQRGIGFARVGGVHIDIGAFESATINAAPTITSLAAVNFECLGANTPATINADVADANGDLLTVTWSEDAQHVDVPAASPNATMATAMFSGSFSIGSRVVTFSVTDGKAPAVTSQTTVTIKDTTPPVITLVGASPLTLEFGSAFTDPGAIASDICAGNLTSAIVRTGSVNTSALGT